MRIIWLLVIVLAAAAVYVGMQMSRWFATRTEVRVCLEEVCGGDETCAAAVESSYVECFGGAFSHAWKPAEATLDVVSLVQCVNEAAPGEPFVALDVYTELDSRSLPCRLLAPDHPQLR